METGTITSSEIPPMAHYHNRRREARVKLPVTLYVRRPVNSSYYWRIVEADNVSRHGARIVCDVKLEDGTQLEISGLGGKFSALAEVRHAERRQEGKWFIGLEFLEKSGSWIVS